MYPAPTTSSSLSNPIAGPESDDMSYLAAQLALPELKQVGLGLIASIDLAIHSYDAQTQVGLLEGWKTTAHWLHRIHALPVSSVVSKPPQQAASSAPTLLAGSIWKYDEMYSPLVSPTDSINRLTSSHYIMTSPTLYTFFKLYQLLYARLGVAHDLASKSQTKKPSDVF